MALLSELMVWKHVDSKSAVRYCCFHDLKNNKYAVQSADFFSLPVDEKQLRFLNIQFLELLMETSPSERCTWYPSVEDAIAAHDDLFS
jgi:hypothetical protein